MRLLRVIAGLLVLALVALTGYAYFGDMGADPQPMRVPVQIDLGELAAAPAAPGTAAASAPEALAPATTDAATPETAAGDSAGGADGSLD